MKTMAKNRRKSKTKSIPMFSFKKARDLKPDPIPYSTDLEYCTTGSYKEMSSIFADQ